MMLLGAQRSALFPYTTLFRSHWASGLASSFRAGVAALPQDAVRVVVTLVDQPGVGPQVVARLLRVHQPGRITAAAYDESGRSEEHTSELQSRFDLVCRLLLVK